MILVVDCNDDNDVIYDSGDDVIDDNIDDGDDVDIIGILISLCLSLFLSPSLSLCISLSFSLHLSLSLFHLLLFLVFLLFPPLSLSRTRDKERYRLRKQTRKNDVESFRWAIHNIRVNNSQFSKLESTTLTIRLFLIIRSVEWLWCACPLLISSFLPLEFVYSCWPYWPLYTVNRGTII